MRATAGQRNVLRLTQIRGRASSGARRLASGYVTTMAEVGAAMLKAVRQGYPKPVPKAHDSVAPGTDQPAAVDL